MLPNYKDIIAIAGKPAWYDEYGVPRYCPFAPAECGVYISAAALLLIQCQNCQQKFKVAATWNSTDDMMEVIRASISRGTGHWVGTPTPKEPYLESAPSYGDPPIHNCVGDTMTSETLRVLELWNSDHWDWERKEEVEEKMNKKLEGM